MESSDTEDINREPGFLAILEKVQHKGLFIVAFATIMNLSIQAYDQQVLWWCMFGSVAWGLMVILGLRHVKRTRSRPELLGVICAQAFFSVSTLATPTMPPRLFVVLVATGITALLLPVRQSAVIGLTMASALVGMLSVHHLHLENRTLPHPLWILVPFSFLYLGSVTVRQSIVSRLVAERTSHKLSELNRELQVALTTANELATERERTRIARELHDSIGHSLTTGNVHLEAAHKFLVRGNTERAERSLKRAKEATHTGLDELRSCVSLLREPREITSLTESIAELVESFPTEHYTLHYEQVGEERRMEAARQFTLFRATQEALTNIAKHSEATHVYVTLSYKKQSVEVEVRDDGIGAPQTLSSPGHGLKGLAERLQALDGELRTSSSPEQGFTLMALLPA